MLAAKKPFVNEINCLSLTAGRDHDYHEDWGERIGAESPLTSAGGWPIIQFVMITNRDALRGILAGRGIKPTAQRLTILGAVMGNRSHPTIRALHAALVRRIPTLSKTTLYSTLERFAAEGLVRSLTIDPVEARYDGVTVPHHHFFCTACGRVLDIEISCPNGRAGEIHGHRIDEVHGYFKGLCRDCRAQKAPKSKRRFSHA